MKYFNKYNKWLYIALVVIIVASASIVAVNVFCPDQALACRDEGCNVYFWKCQQDYWVRYNANDTVRTLFSEAERYKLGSGTLIVSLGFNGYYCYTRESIAARILLRQGIAAKLNVSNPQIDYHVSGTSVTKMVNEALASGNAIKMLKVARSLYQWNNAGCPFCQ